MLKSWVGRYISYTQQVKYLQNKMCAQRKQTADSLKKASVSYLLKKGYSCFTELGLNSWGKLRADVLALNLKADIVLFEVKSSVDDYVKDTKWKCYIEYSNKMYFIFSEPVFNKLEARLRSDLKSTGVGVLILCPTSGYLKSVISAKRRVMLGKTKRTLVIRMAWRSGESKRTHRRQRVFLTDFNTLAV